MSVEQKLVTTSASVVPAPSIGKIQYRRHDQPILQQDQKILFISTDMDPVKHSACTTAVD